MKDTNIYSFNENIKNELLEVGLSPDNFEDACLWLSKNGYKENASGGNVSNWFFFSQFLFIVVSLKSEFKHKKIIVKKEEISMEVSYLAYSLILYSTSELVPEAICIALKGKDYSKEAKWSIDSLFLSIFNSRVLSSAWKEAEKFLFGYTKAKNMKKANVLPGLTTLQTLGLLRKNKISISQYTKANEDHSVYKNSKHGKLRKSAAYWDILLNSMHSPMIIPSTDNARKTLMLTQGNLPHAVFILYHYTLLWEAKLQNNGKVYATKFFKEEIDCLTKMFSLKRRDNKTNDHYGIYQVFNDVLSEEVFNDVLSQLYIAISFTKSEDG